MEEDPSDLWWKVGVDDDQVLDHYGGNAGLWLCKRENVWYLHLLVLHVCNLGALKHHLLSYPQNGDKSDNASIVRKMNHTKEHKHHNIHSINIIMPHEHIKL
jgi:hypothetical protein